MNIKKSIWAILFIVIVVIALIGRFVSSSNAETDVCPKCGCKEHTVREVILDGYSYVQIYCKNCNEYFGMQEASIWYKNHKD